MSKQLNVVSLSDFRSRKLTEAAKTANASQVPSAATIPVVNEFMESAATKPKRRKKAEPVAARPLAPPRSVWTLSSIMDTEEGVNLYGVEKIPSGEIFYHTSAAKRFKLLFESFGYSKLPETEAHLITMLEDCQLILLLSRDLPGADEKHQEFWLEAGYDSIRKCRPDLLNNWNHYIKLLREEQAKLTRTAEKPKPSR